mmetsp:Transcript_23670/g.65711  ORF Transcript_23670/g.65711 Transcript_23670/m.65711 type:complete len:287 (+) Transcript_23670:84-944(+)
MVSGSLCCVSTGLMPRNLPFRRALVLASTISMSRTSAFVGHRNFPSFIPQRHTSVSNNRHCLSSLSEEHPRESILKRSPKEDEKILCRTLDWVQRAVIGLNLCPFAEKPFQKKQMNLEVIRGCDQVDILTQILGECLVKKKQPGTSLMICPDLFPSNFISFLEVYNMLQDGVLVDNHLDEYIQVAPFHPLFEFEGSAENIDNFTNRSPYPIFHILREEEVSLAVDALQGDSERVWKRNVELLEELEDQLGREKTTQILSGVETDLTTREKVKEVVKKIKNGRLPEI